MMAERNRGNIDAGLSNFVTPYEMKAHRGRDRFLTKPFSDADLMARSPTRRVGNGVIAELEHDGYRVIAAAKPLRGVAGDAQTVSAIVRSVHGPVLLVGHSYGGPVITEAASHSRDVRGLVYRLGAPRGVSLP